MQLTEYLDYKFFGSEKESEYQHITDEPEEYYRNKAQELNKELAKLYVKRVFDLENFKPSVKVDFLNYHYEKYAGNKLDFIYMVEDLSAPLRIGSYDFYLWPRWLDS